MAQGSPVGAEAAARRVPIPRQGQVVPSHEDPPGSAFAQGQELSPCCAKQGNLCSV